MYFNFLSDCNFQNSGYMRIIYLFLNVFQEVNTFRVGFLCVASLINLFI